MLAYGSEMALKVKVSLIDKISEGIMYTHLLKWPSVSLLFVDGPLQNYMDIDLIVCILLFFQLMWKL